METFEYGGVTYTKQSNGSWLGDNNATLTSAQADSLMRLPGAKMPTSPESGDGTTGSPTATQVFQGPQGYGRYQYNPQTQRYDIFQGSLPIPGGESMTEEQRALEHQRDLELRNTPSRSISSSTTQVFQDPRALALQEQEFAAQQANLQQQYAQWQQEFGLSARQINARIANDNAQLAFLQAKHADEMRLGDAAAARDTLRLMEQIDARHAQDEFQQQSLMQQARVTNANFQMQAAQLNEQMRVANLQQRQSVARDISEFTRRPGDVGAAAGFLRAGGGSPISTALAEGETAVTPQSLAILNNMLAVSDEVMRDPPQIQAPQIQMPQFTPQQPLDVAGLLAQLTAPPAQETQTPTTTAFQPEWIKNEQGTGYWAQDEQGKWVGYVPGGPGVVNKNVLDRGWELPTFEKGGILDGVGIVGDSSDGKENEELVMGDAMIIPLDKFSPEQRKRIKKMAQKYQTGGVMGNPLMRAQGFLDDAAALAMQMGGFSRVPSPVQMATPGQSPFMAELGAAVASTARGIPQELFFEELQKVMPQGIRDNVVRRTR